MRKMKMLTIPVEKDFYKQVRIAAANEDKSMARYVRDILFQKLKVEKVERR